MAGITDLPFRKICKNLGAGLVVSEMTAANPDTWNSKKTKNRIKFQSEEYPRSVQIAGFCPKMMANAAIHNVQLGAQVIDINMGCPAKKVCKRAAGSALLKEPELVNKILISVVDAVEVPVTLKIRTGWDKTTINAIQIAKIAENAGISALAIHGRTRACRFVGEVEYETIARVAESISIPVFANGDIDSPKKAKDVIEKTGATAVMIGRNALGKPWIFDQINEYLSHGTLYRQPSKEEIQKIVMTHLKSIHKFYGESTGLKFARKHMNWYLGNLNDGKPFSKFFNSLKTTYDQIVQMETFLSKGNMVLKAA
jgi:tRNA-dihydrouridine synthase B